MSQPVSVARSEALRNRLFIGELAASDVQDQLVVIRRTVVICGLQISSNPMVEGEMTEETEDRPTPGGSLCFLLHILAMLSGDDCEGSCKQMVQEEELGYG